MAGIHVSVSFKNSRELVIQLVYANSEFKMMSQKMCLAGVLLYLDVEVEWDTAWEEELPFEVNEIHMETWEQQFLGLFEKTEKYGDSEFLRSLKVCHKESDSKIDP